VEICESAYCETLMSLFVQCIISSIVRQIPVHHFPVLQFPPLQLRPSFSSPANSRRPFWPTSMPNFILIHPTVWPQCTNVTDRQDRQRGQDRHTDNGLIAYRANRFTNSRPKNFSNDSYSFIHFSFILISNKGPNGH